MIQLLYLRVILFLLLLQLPAIILRAQGTSGRSIRLLAKLKYASDYSRYNAFQRDWGIQFHELYGGKDQQVNARQQDAPLTVSIEIDTTRWEASIIDYFRDTHLFEYVERDASGMAATVAADVLISPDDQGFSKQWGLYNDGTFRMPAKPRADIHMPEAWTVTQGSKDIVVAILDTGIKTDHPEFSGRLWRNGGEVPENGIDDDGNGYVDDVNGWNFVVDGRGVADDAGHGTHVAGIIGAQGNNAKGYAGVDWNCQLMICKVLDANFSGYYSWWSQAIHYAVDNGADIINMSLGGEEFSHTLEEAVDYARQHNVLVVASMQNFNSSVVYYPAGHASVLAVGSTDPDDARSTSFSGTRSGSNYGNHIDLVAPGNYIYGLSFRSDNDDTYMLSGTSQASPLVSGVAALLWAQDRSRTVSDIEQMLTGTADDEVGNPVEDIQGWDPFYGYGRLNAWRALQGDVSPDVKTEDVLDVFPVPATSVLNVGLPMQEASVVTITLHDMRGAVVMQYDLPEQRILTEHLYVEGVSPGMYLLTVASKNHRWSRKVIIR